MTVAYNGAYCHAGPNSGIRATWKGDAGSPACYAVDRTRRAIARRLGRCPYRRTPAE